MPRPQGSNTDPALHRRLQARPDARQARDHLLQERKLPPCVQGVKGCEAGDVSARSLQTARQPGSERIDHDLEHDRDSGRRGDGGPSGCCPNRNDNGRLEDKKRRRGFGQPVEAVDLGPLTIDDDVAALHPGKLRQRCAEHVELGG